MESKTGTRGTFVRANTNKGWYSAFEEPAMTLLLQSVGKDLMCQTEAKVSGDKTYNNIVGAELVGQQNLQEHNGLSPNIPSIPSQDVTPGVTPQPQPKPITNKYEPNSMYTSYAKDIFGMLWNEWSDEKKTPAEIMFESIKLVKQARDAF